MAVPVQNIYKIPLSLLAANVLKRRGNFCLEEPPAISTKKLEIRPESGKSCRVNNWNVCSPLDAIHGSSLADIRERASEFWCSDAGEMFALQ